MTQPSQAPEPLVCLYLAQAREHVRLGEWPDGLVAASAALQAAGALDDEAQLAEALDLQSQCLWLVLDYAAALDAAIAAASFYAKLQDGQAYVEVMARMAIWFAGLDLLEDSLRCATLALQAARQDPNNRGLSRALGCLANVQAAQGDFDAADTLHLQALSRARETKSARELAITLNNLLASAVTACNVLGRRGEVPRLQATAQSSAKFVSQAIPLLTDPQVSGLLRCSLMLNIGMTFGLQGDAQRALEFLTRGLDEAMAQQAQAIQSNAQHCLADWYFRNGQAQKALPMLMDLLDRSEVQASDKWRQNLWDSLHDACLALGRDEDARHWLELRQAMVEQGAARRALLKAHLNASSDLAWQMLSPATA